MLCLHLRSGEFCSISWRSLCIHINCLELFWKDLSVFFLLFIYSIIYSCHYGLLNIYFIHWIIILYYFMYFVAQNCSSFGYCEVFLFPPLFLWHIFIFIVILRISIISITTRCSTVIMYISCPNTRIGYFSKDSWFLWLKTDIIYWRIGALATGVSIFLGPLIWQSKEIYVCIITPTDTHTYKYLYMYSFISILS